MRFGWLGRNVAALDVKSTKNRQTTFGDLFAAIYAVQSRVGTKSWMSCTSDGYDDVNKVGQGTMTPGGLAGEMSRGIG